MSLIVNFPAINKNVNKTDLGVFYVIVGHALSWSGSGGLFVLSDGLRERQQKCGGMWASETQRAETSPVIGANAAFNNRTKEELEMHMFKKCGFSPNPRSLSLSVALVILY